MELSISVFVAFLLTIAVPAIANNPCPDGLHLTPFHGEESGLVPHRGLNTSACMDCSPNGLLTGSTCLGCSTQPIKPDDIGDMPSV